jgi:aspartyl-tRNA(Asn)/glutamyl-tRNA(Gln) amidotransferase subunit C
MSVDTATVKRIAKLARIRVEEPDLAPLAGELDTILHWVEQLGEVDATNVEPMNSVMPSDLKRRADQVSDGGYPEDVLANAPEARHGFFVVHKIAE